MLSISGSKGGGASYLNSQQPVLQIIHQPLVVVLSCCQSPGCGNQQHQHRPHLEFLGESRVPHEPVTPVQSSTSRVKRCEGQRERTRGRSEFPNSLTALTLLECFHKLSGRSLVPLTPPLLSPEKNKKKWMNVLQEVCVCVCVCLSRDSNTRRTQLRTHTFWWRTFVCSAFPALHFGAVKIRAQGFYTSIHTLLQDCYHMQLPDEMQSVALLHAIIYLWAYLTVHINKHWRGCRVE